MSADREMVELDPPLTSYQTALVRAVTPTIRGARQADFHTFIADMLRGVQNVTDHDVRRAIDEAAMRYGRPR